MKYQYKLKYSGPAIVLSSGLVYYKNKRPQGLTLDKVMKLFKDHPKTSFHEVKIERITTLGDATISKRLNEIGTIKSYHTSIDFNRMIHGRYFTNLPKNGHQVMNNIYESIPMEVNIAKNKELD